MSPLGIRIHDIVGELLGPTRRRRAGLGSADRLSRKRSIVLGLALGACAPVVASASDLPAPRAPAPNYAPAPFAGWSGFYAGSFVGGVAGAAATSQAISASGVGYGVVGGALAGYNFESGRWVYGVEGDIGSTSVQHFFNARPGLVANEVDGVYEGHARARLGWDFGNGLPYLAGGLAIERFDQYQSPPLDFDGASHTRVGWTLGVGLDAKLDLPLLGLTTLRAEYLHEGFPSAIYALGGVAAKTSVGGDEFRVAMITPVGAEGRSPVETGAADWSGSYFGGLGGAARQTVSTKGLGASDSFAASGGLAGIYSGHNWMFGSAMLGVDGSTTLGDVQGGGPQPGAASTRYRDYFDSVFQGRAGYAFGRFLPFVAAGLAWGDSENSDAATGHYRDATTQLSGVVGLGVDYMATDRVAFRLEYRRVATLGSTTTRLDSDGCCAQSVASDGFRVGVGYFLH